MSYDPYADDAFGGSNGEKTPSVSFADQPVGYSVTMLVTEPPQPNVQTRNFDTQELEFWKEKDGSNGNPKVATVVTGTVNGETQALWVRKYPSYLLEAVRDAQVKANTRIKPGGTLTVTVSGHKVNPDKPRLKPANLFTVTYQDADAFAEDAKPAQTVSAPTTAPFDAVAAMYELKPTITGMLSNGITAEQIATLGVVKFNGKTIDAGTVAAIAGLA